MDLQTLKTKSGKTIQDFNIPQKLLEKDQELIDLVLRSEAMNDEEKQYWFTLTEVMNEDQMNKLYDILRRERKKLDEIDAKYGKKQTVDPVEALKKAENSAAQRIAQQETIQKREQAVEAQEHKEEEAILQEINQLPS